MSFLIKLSLAKKLLQALGKPPESNIFDLIKNLKLSKNSDENVFNYTIPCEAVDNWSKIVLNLKHINVRDKQIILPVDRSELIFTVLSSAAGNNDYKTHERTIVEFSSPNVAKPFHIGHFRSTILGNFVANLSKCFTKDVIKINYLGDWGTQIGMIKIGLEEMNVNKSDLHRNPLDVLYRAYVKANELAKDNPDVQRQASDCFNRLENFDDEESTQDWNDFRKYSVEELKETYERLGIEFDEYHWESDYAAKKIKPVLDSLKALPDIIEGQEYVLKNGDKNITLLKSNGSTLYLTRDIAAAIDRYRKYSFDKMIYVTDLSQENHFKDLINILDRLNYSWSSKIQHIRYGKISGMSTRKGKGVFLKDLLDEARDRMYDKQKNTKTTKISLEDRSVSDVLGMSSLIVYHLKMRRNKGFTFNWNECLQLTGDGGVKLQYTHCRLVSLEVECGKQLPLHCDPNFLQEPVAIKLVTELARFDDVLHSAQEAYESSVLVVYLFRLTNAINLALKELQVKNCDDQTGRQRLLLFHKARLILKEGMLILGLKPLNKM